MRAEADGVWMEKKKKNPSIILFHVVTAGQGRQGVWAKKKAETQCQRGDLSVYLIYAQNDYLVLQI